MRQLAQPDLHFVARYLAVSVGIKLQNCAQLADLGVVERRIARRRGKALQFRRGHRPIFVLVRPDKVHGEPPTCCRRPRCLGHCNFRTRYRAIAVKVGPLQPRQRQRPRLRTGQCHDVPQANRANGFAIAIARDQGRHLFQIGGRIVRHLLGQGLRYRARKGRSRHENQKRQNQAAHSILHACCPDPAAKALNERKQNQNNSRKISDIAAARSPKAVFAL